MRLGFAFPEAGTIQRSFTTSFSLYDGSVMLNTTHLPSGLISGAPTRFSIVMLSWVIGFFVWAFGAANESRQKTAIKYLCICLNCKMKGSGIGFAKVFQDSL